MSTATVTSKGQVTIPQKVREHLGLGTGDKIDFVIAKDGSIQVRVVAGSVRRLYGFLKRPGNRIPTVEDMDSPSWIIYPMKMLASQKVKNERARFKHIGSLHHGG